MLKYVVSKYIRMRLPTKKKTKTKYIFLISAGLTVTGLSGNIRTHIFLPRRTFRVIARRPASICLDVIHASSSVD